MKNKIQLAILQTILKLLKSFVFNLLVNVELEMKEKSCI